MNDNPNSQRFKRRSTAKNANTSKKLITPEMLEKIERFNGPNWSTTNPWFTVGSKAYTRKYM